MREAKLAIRLNETIKDRLQEYAESYGLSMSQLAAFIIGSWISNQERIAKPLIEQIVNQADEQSDKMMEVMSKIMATTMKEITDEAKRTS